MAIRQSNANEIRFLKRQNLQSTSKIVDNMYRDQIHAQGIDCIYYKLDTKKFKEYKGIVDANTVLRHAYGYDDAPDYSISAEMPVFVETNDDIFNLNKYGLLPNTEQTFVIHKKDFAYMMASKCGQYKEYPIDEKEIVCDIPEYNAETSSESFPYLFGYGYQETFTCNNLSGKISCEISSYVEGQEQTVLCHPYEHSDLVLEFPVNDDIYKSFTYKIKSNDYIDSMIYLTFTVNKIQINKNKYKYILRGKLHGTMLFYDIHEVGKYTELIHPEVGDIIAIDFPDEANREKYELTQVVDKQMTTDGINPFLHKYVWKCIGKRYHNSYEDIPENEADERVDELIKLDQVIREDINKKISIYENGEDKAYGGYESHTDKYDKQIAKTKKTTKYEYMPSGTSLDIMCFANGTRLVTNGYNLTFVDTNDIATDIVYDNYKQNVKQLFGAFYETGLDYLKATDDTVVFVNIEGTAFTIVRDEEATAEEMVICLNSLYDKTIEESNGLNKKNDNFFKFKGTRTVLFSNNDSLFIRLANGKMYKIA